MLIYKVLCLLVGPSAAPSSRYGVYYMVPYLHHYGVDVVVSPFYCPTAYEKMRRGQQGRLEWVGQMGLGYLKRVRDIVEARRCDAVWIHRFAAPVGTGLLGSVVKALGKPLVFSYDDAVHLPTGRGGRLRIGSWRGINGLISRSDYVIAWNRGLGDHARQYNRHVIVLPSVLDVALYDRVLEAMPPARDDASAFVLGWIGTPQNAAYLQSVRHVLEELGREGPVEMRLIGGDMADLKNVCVRRVVWRQETEIQELAQLDVGIAPMPDNEWTRGKSGYKVLQYMGSGLPVVASAIGPHLDLIEPGVQGFLVSTEEEWLQALTSLRDDRALRSAMGEAGRQTVRLRHDYPQAAKALANVLIQACEKRG